MSGQEGKNLSTQSIHSKKSRSAIKFARPQVTQEFVHERRSCADRTMNSASNSNDTRRRSSSGQCYFAFHSARSNVVALLAGRSSSCPGAAPRNALDEGLFASV